MSIAKLSSSFTIVYMALLSNWLAKFYRRGASQGVDSKCQILTVLPLYILITL